MNKALVAVLLMGLCIFPITGHAAINLADMGKETEVSRAQGRVEPAISLDGITLPKGVYYSDFSVVVRTEATLQEGVEIQFETWDYKLGFFVEGNAKLEKGVFMHPVNSKGEEPKWLGISVMPGGRLEADNVRLEGVDDEQFAWWLIYGTAVIRNSEISRVRVSHLGDSPMGGNLKLENSVIDGLSFTGDKLTLMAKETLFKLSNPEGTPEKVHALAFDFEGSADFSDNNKWEGNKPLFYIVEFIGEQDIRSSISDPNELAKRGIKVLPPTAVLQNTWGEIKKMFLK